MCMESLIQHSLILHPHLHLYALVRTSGKLPRRQQLWLSGTSSQADVALQLDKCDVVQRLPNAFVPSVGELEIGCD